MGLFRTVSKVNGDFSGKLHIFRTRVFNAVLWGFRWQFVTMVVFKILE